jgi:hypothetical protein
MPSMLARPDPPLIGSPYPRTCPDDSKGLCRSRASPLHSVQTLLMALSKSRKRRERTSSRLGALGQIEGREPYKIKQISAVISSSCWTLLYQRRSQGREKRENRSPSKIPNLPSIGKRSGLMSQTRMMSRFSSSSSVAKVQKMSRTVVQETHLEDPLLLVVLVVWQAQWERVLE